MEWVPIVIILGMMCYDLLNLHLVEKANGKELHRLASSQLAHPRYSKCVCRDLSEIRQENSIESDQTREADWHYAQRTHEESSKSGIDGKDCGDSK